MCVGAITTHGGGGVSSDVTRIGSRQYIQFQAEVVAHTPIGVMTRVALTRAVAHTLPPTLDEQTAAVALLYTLSAGTPGARSKRVRVYVRWSLTFDDSDAGSALHAARTRRQLREAFERLRGQVQAYYTLKPASGADLAAVQRAALGAQAAELAYTRLLHTPEGLAPVHVQPTLDLLGSRPACAALQFTVERLSGDGLHGEAVGVRRLRFGVVAAGAAAAPGALRLLAQELRGRGVLVTRTPSPAAPPPKLNVFRPQSAGEQAHICHNLCAPAAEPWPQISQPVDMAITGADAALLLPLPFALFE